VDQLPALISSGTALLATAVSLFLLRQGQVDRREVRREKDREQARQVTAWCDWHSDADYTFAKPRLPAVFVKNSSQAAVYDVFIDYRAPEDGALFRVALGPLPPGDTRTKVIDYEGHLPDNWEPAALFARVNYRDADGSRWIRDSIGRLRIDPGPGNDGFLEEGGVLLKDYSRRHLIAAV
jgi:hypothetical protein